MCVCVYFFLFGDRYLGDGDPDQREVLLMVEVSPGQVLSAFGGAIFRGN